MSSRRVLKAAEAIREVVSMTILTDLRDPRVEGVTVTFVEVSPDMRQAKVHVSIMGSEAQQKLCLRGLQSSAGFLQSKISDRIDTGNRRESDPLRPILPDARNIISAPTFFSRWARSRKLPLAKPTVKTISKIPIPIPAILTTVRAGR